MAVLNGGGLNSRTALANVKEGELAVVLASANQAAVLHVEIEGGQLALRPQLQLWGRRVVHIPDVAAQRGAFL